MIRDKKRKLTQACMIAIIFVTGFALGHFNARHEILPKQAHALSAACNSLIASSWCSYNPMAKDGSQNKAIFIDTTKDIHAV